MTSNVRLLLLALTSGSIAIACSQGPEAESVTSLAAKQTDDHGNEAAAAAKEGAPRTSFAIDEGEPTKDLFCPKSPVTRRDMAYYLERIKHGRDFSPPAAQGQFDDVKRSSKDEQWIEQLFADGITKGCGDRAYCPDEAVPREQMAAFIIRLTHGPDFTRTSPSRFVDVTGGSEQFSGYIEQLADDGITFGCDADHFCPRDTVLREQMAAFLMRAAHPGSPTPPGTGRFADVGANSGDLAGRVEQAVEEGIMEPCARAQIAVGTLTEPDRNCKFICDFAAGSACLYATKNPYATLACTLAADRYLCNDLCTEGNWKQMCFITQPEYGCSVCCQDIYGCGPEQCVFPPAY